MCLINKAGGEQADTWPYDTSSYQVAKLSPSPDDICWWQVNILFSKTQHRNIHDIICWQEMAYFWHRSAVTTVTKIKENSDQNHCKNCHKMALLEAVEEIIEISL